MAFDTDPLEVMTLDELATLLKLSRATVLAEHDRDPEFPRYKRIGRQYRFKRQDVVEYLADARCTSPVPGSAA